MSLSTSDVWLRSKGFSNFYQILKLPDGLVIYQTLGTLCHAGIYPAYDMPKTVFKQKLAQIDYFLYQL